MIAGSKYLGAVRFGEKHMKAISCLSRRVSDCSAGCRESHSHKSLGRTVGNSSSPGQVGIGERERRSFPRTLWAREEAPVSTGRVVPPPQALAGDQEGPCCAFGVLLPPLHPTRGETLG